MSGIILAPAWSPDGQWLVFLELAGSTYRLMKVGSADGQTPVELASSIQSGAAVGPVLPEWSPTGDWIAYPGENGSLALVSPDGKRGKALGGNGPVAWSRTGKALYQVRESDRAIVEVDPVSGSSRLVRGLGSLLPYATRGPGRRVSLTPDGKNLVYGVLRPREEIWLFDGIRRNDVMFGALADWLRPPGR